MRYIADFGWLFALAALPSLLIVLDCGKPRLRWVCRAGFLALLLFTLVVALMSLFLPGRDDEMLRNNPALYLDVQSGSCWVDVRHKLHPVKIQVSFLIHIAVFPVCSEFHRQS